MHWMSVKLPDNFQMREHSWPCRFHIIFYELALLLIICPFPAILFSLSASYNLIIFYELALSLVICPFPAILFS